mmetsp:Transcript_687/g.2178  ORF Transcript_687/g.2178 Transcript_687/m.2178 type:complete len:237 (+) Transcript_687:328-1038(+)
MPRAQELFHRGGGERHPVRDGARGDVKVRPAHPQPPALAVLLDAVVWQGREDLGEEGGALAREDEQVRGRPAGAGGGAGRRKRPHLARPRVLQEDVVLADDVQPARDRGRLRKQLLRAQRGAPARRLLCDVHPEHRLGQRGQLGPRSVRVGGVVRDGVGAGGVQQHLCRVTQPKGLGVVVWREGGDGVDEHEASGRAAARARPVGHVVGEGGAEGGPNQVEGRGAERANQRVRVAL